MSATPINKLPELHLTVDPVNILLVGSGPGDVSIIEGVFRESRIKNRVEAVPDGPRALDYLRRKDPHGETRRPNIILLDLGHPRSKGLELLREIKSDRRLRSIPVVAIASPGEDGELIPGIENLASCCVTKPADREEYIKTLREIESFWLTIVKLPSGEGAGGRD